MIMTAVITVIAAYLIGSINFAVVFTSLFMHRDIRKMGSGNAGTTNAMRVGGVLPGVLTFVCDVLKGFVACYGGQKMFEYIFSQTESAWALPIYGAYICGLVCMLGHIFPVFFGFKGGKGVAVSVGIYAVCCPTAIIIGLAAFALAVIISKIVSISSIIATFVVVILSIVFYNKSAALFPQVLLSVAMGAIVILKHIPNIKRLLAGEEKPFKIRR